MPVSSRHRADDRLAVGLASGLTVREAARQAGIGERTAHRRLNEPTFRRRVSELRGQAIDRAVSLLADGAAEAVRVLRELLKEDSAPIRLSAARTLLECAFRARELGDLEDRIAELETAAAIARGQSRRWN